MSTTKKTPASRTRTTTTKKVVVEQTVKRVYKDDDKIPCFSITPGKYVFDGEKSGTVYRWVDQGITEDVRYDDLTSAIRTRKPCVYKPRVIIQDEEFLQDYPEIQRLYDSMYSMEDLGQILELDPTRLAEVVKNLPDGAKDAVKSLAMERIDNGTFDSASRVRVLDQIFGTDMLIKLIS